MALLNRQKVELFEAVKKNGFDPTEFAYTEAVGTKIEARLTFQKGPYLCNIESTDSVISKGYVYDIATIPGKTRMKQNNYLKQWDELLIGVVNEWLVRLRAELNTPDPWVNLSNQLGPDYASGEQNNSPLSVAEWEQIERGVEKIRQVMLADKPEDGEAQKVINQKLDDLIDGGKRMGRVDWFNQAIGTIMNVIVAVSLSQEAQRTIWGLLKSAVSGVVHLLPVVQKAIGF